MFFKKTKDNKNVTTQINYLMGMILECKESIAEIESKIKVQSNKDELYKSIPAYVSKNAIDISNLSNELYELKKELLQIHSCQNEVTINSLRNDLQETNRKLNYSNLELNNTRKEIEVVSESFKKLHAESSDKNQYIKLYSVISRIEEQTKKEGSSARIKASLLSERLDKVEKLVSALELPKGLTWEELISKLQMERDTIKLAEESRERVETLKRNAEILSHPDPITKKKPRYDTLYKPFSTKREAPQINSTEYKTVSYGDGASGLLNTSTGEIFQPQVNPNPLASSGPKRKIYSHGHIHEFNPEYLDVLTELEEEKFRKEHEFTEDIDDDNIHRSYLVPADLDCTGIVPLIIREESEMPDAPIPDEQDSFVQPLDFN